MVGNKKHILTIVLLLVTAAKKSCAAPRDSDASNNLGPVLLTTQEALLIKRVLDETPHRTLEQEPRRAPRHTTPPITDEDMADLIAEEIAALRDLLESIESGNKEILRLIKQIKSLLQNRNAHP
jgi:hypothetical protein